MATINDAPAMTQGMIDAPALATGVPSGVPHEWQKRAPGVRPDAHLGHFAPGREVPHSAQYLPGDDAPHFGHWFWSFMVSNLAGGSFMGTENPA